MTKNKKAKLKSLRDIKSRVLNELKANPSQEFNYKQLAARLDLHAHEERDTLLKILQELLSEGSLEELVVGKFKPVLNEKYVIGKVEVSKSGSAFLIVENVEEDVFLPPRRLRNALNGDVVKVLIFARKTGKKLEGEVVEILSRKKMDFSGVIQVSDRYGFVVPDDQRMHVDIFVPGNYFNGARDGDKVIVHITEFEDGKKNPIGKVTKILGRPGEHHAEMNSIIAEFDLPTEFPTEVELESQAIKDEISKEEIAKRRDFRNILTFTIDPFDAKDFDDAISFRVLEEGRYEVGVHIADVTHYIEQGTALDKEALTRATSVYLVDRVIPMLPEKLSNELCSLRPDEDKLTFSVVVELNNEAEILKEWYGRTIIHSARRYSYEEAQEILETGIGDNSEALLTLNKLAYKLREKKFANGAISFETEEVKFELDSNGKPLRVIKKIRKDAHKLIEDYMLLANKKVAEFIFKKNQKKQNTPFVYRSHDSPNQDKLKDFKRLATSFGYKINMENDKVLAKSLNALLIAVEGKPEQNMIQSIAIRTMAKALYTTKKTSHYGLAFDYYTHFTSPIRRYPDMIAHRLLAHYLEDKKDIKQEIIEAQCKHSSEMEIRASEAERASIKYKQVEYMMDKKGIIFNGIISGVTERGIYVEVLETKCEGMVRLNQLTDDIYTYEEDKYLIKGINTGQIFRLGDNVKVIIRDTNLQKRTIDFELVS